MIRFRTSILAAALGFAALASSPARADLYVYGGATEGTITEQYNGTGLGNGQEIFAGNVNGFGVALIISGETDLGAPDLFDVSNVSIDDMMNGNNTLALQVTETGLTSLTGVENFLSTFSGQISKTIDVTATFFFNADNTQTVEAGATQLGQITCNAGTCTSYTQNFSKLINSISGPFSLTEDFDISANYQGKLSSDDDVSEVPEPVSLSLFGSGLLALGALSRRRRKAAKSA